MQLDSKKIIFMGTPRFAGEILKNLVGKQIPLDCVFTRPDKPVGRKAILMPTPVKEVALEFGIELVQKQKFDQETISFLQSKKPDLIIVAAYGVILPKEVLAIPKFGCINVHASLLPKFRGASPIHEALKQGETNSGVSIMLMDEGIDTGPVFFEKSVQINEQDKYLELENKLIDAANEILIPTLEKIINAELQTTPQQKEGVSLTKMIKKEAGKIDWGKQTAKDIFNSYRAFCLWPKIYAFFIENAGSSLKRKVTLTFSGYETSDYSKEVGQVFKDNENNRLLIQTKKGVLVLKTVQIEGKKELAAKDFINGKPNFIQTILK